MYSNEIEWNRIPMRVCSTPWVNVPVLSGDFHTVDLAHSTAKVLGNIKSSVHSVNRAQHVPHVWPTSDTSVKLHYNNRLDFRLTLWTLLATLANQDQTYKQPLASMSIVSQDNTSIICQLDWVYSFCCDSDNKTCTRELLVSASNLCVSVPWHCRVRVYNLHFSHFSVPISWPWRKRWQWCGDNLCVGYLCTIESKIPPSLKQFVTSSQHQSSDISRPCVYPWISAIFGCLFLDRDTYDDSSWRIRVEG